MRILLLTYHYPPDPEVGGLRPARLAAAFRARGHEVAVIAAARTPATAGDVHRVVPLRNPREFYLALRSRRALRATDESARSNGAVLEDGQPPTAAWKRFILSLLWLPDDCQGFIPRALARARRLHGQRPFDRVYTSAPPFSTHLAGLLFSRLTGVPWVAEFRDPWIGGAGKPARVRSGFSEAADVWLHDRCMRRARQVVAVTDAAARSLTEQRARAHRTPALLARNGIDRFDAPPRRDAGPVRIVYLGNLYLGRNPQPLLHAIATLRHAGRLPATGVTIEFVGDCRRFHDQSVEQLVRDLELTDVVTFGEPVPHHAVAELMRGADILLLLAQRQPIQVPNKLYEYLGANRPILAFADRAGESSTMLRAVGGHFLIHEEDSAQIAATVERALRSCREPLAVRTDILREWSSENQMARLVAEIERDLADQGIAATRDQSARR